MHLVIGGSASGKSAYAEEQAAACGRNRNHPLFYVATMRPWGEEGRRRVEKHRRMRQGKGFATIECCVKLGGLTLPAGEQRPVVLLECLSNLTANEQFETGGSDEEICSRILEGIGNLNRQAACLVAVTCQVDCDGICYEPETERYIRLLGEVNRRAAALADQVTEVVFGIPILIKGPEGRER